MYHYQDQESIIHLMQSIMKYFNLDVCHPTLLSIDNILNHKKYNHVVLVVLDGLGHENLMEHLDRSSFLRNHLLGPLSTVFPPTTTAATTSLLSGLYPSEHGWLGWNVYIEELSDTITLFKNESKYHHEKKFSIDVGHTYFPYTSIVDRIHLETQNKGYTVSPYGDTPYDSGNIRDMIEVVSDLSNRDEKSYIYAYFEEPDALMHHYGNDSSLVKQKITELDEAIEQMCSQLKDTLVIITADHGHINVENLFINDYPELNQMLLRETSIEPRACNFYIKEQYMDQFPKLFNELFGDKFKLLSNQEVHNREIFGPLDSNSKIDGVGDFLGIATSHYTLNDSRENYAFRSHHAGSTEREMLVPLIVVGCN